MESKLANVNVLPFKIPWGWPKTDVVVCDGSIRTAAALGGAACVAEVSAPDADEAVLGSDVAAAFPLRPRAPPSRRAEAPLSDAVGA